MSQPLKRILYVEDEPDIRQIATFSLKAVGGFEVCPCSSGEEALREGPDFKPDLLLLDVMMPAMDGLQTLEAARAHPVLAAVPVVFMTAKAQEADMTVYDRVGALGVIAKPCQATRLPERVRALWEGRHGG